MGDISNATSRIIPYGGSEDYIFISYSHKDTDAIFPILRHMKECGYRFWYDEGIDPGSEWPESIAEHLGRCRVCLAFVSENSLASKNCRREINFAISHDLDFISVILEPVAMSPGMDMQLSTYQSIHKYKYSSEREFFDKLFGVVMLDSCRMAEPTVHLTENVTESEGGSASQSEAAPGMPGKRVQNREEGEKSAGQIGGAGKKSPEKAKGGGAPSILRNRRAVIAIAASLAVIVVIALSFAVAGLFRSDSPGGSTEGGGSTAESVGGTSEQTDASGTDAETQPETGGETTYEEIKGDLVLGGQTYKDDEPGQLISGVTLSVPQVRKLATFKKCGELMFTDCAFEKGAASELGAMENVENLGFVNCTGIDELDFINNMLKLEMLGIQNCGVTDEMVRGIGSNRLSYIYLPDNEITKIPEIAHPENIFQLSLTGNDIVSLDGISEWKKLSGLDISKCGLTSLSGLEMMQTVNELYAEENSISDLTPITGLIYLQRVDLSDNKLTTLEPIKYCEQLKTVDISGNPECRGVETLSASKETLEKLNLSGVKSVDSLSFLKGSTKLTSLYASGCSLTSLLGIEANASLKTVVVSGNKLTDISALAGLPKVYSLDVSGNLLTSLPDLGKISSGTSYVVYIFTDNKLTDIKKLPTVKYDGLFLDGNPLTDLSVLSGHSGSNLVIDVPEGVDPGKLEGTGFSTVYATSLFIGNQAKLEDVVYNVKNTTHDEAFDAITESRDHLLPDF